MLLIELRDKRDTDGVKNYPQGVVGVEDGDREKLRCRGEEEEEAKRGSSWGKSGWGGAPCVRKNVY